MEPYNTSSGGTFQARQDLTSSVSYGGPATTSKSSSVIRTLPLSSARSGYKNPAWRDQVTAHTSATTPCSGVTRSFSPGTIESWFEQHQRFGSPQDITEYFFGTCLPIGSGVRDLPATPAISSSLDNTALTRFYSSIQSQLSHANGMVALGELRDTVRMLKHPMRSMLDLLVKREKSLSGKYRLVRRSTSKRNRKISLREFKNAASGTWLEVQFGLRPFASDIVDLANYLNERRLNLDVEYYKVKGICRSFSKVDQPPGGWGIGHGWSYTIRCHDEVRFKCRFKGEVKVDPLKEAWSGRDFSRLGFGLNQFLPTLWEITPWSFLVDYFTNIGELVNSFSVPKSSVVWYNKTRRSEVKRVWQQTGTTRFKAVLSSYEMEAQLLSASPSIGIAKRFERSGSVGVNLPSPKISFELPSGLKLVNMVALAASDSRRRFSNPSS